MQLKITFYTFAYTACVHQRGSCPEMVLFALVFRSNVTIKRAPPSPWGLGWQTCTIHESIHPVVEACQTCQAKAFLMPERCGWQFSIVVKEFDLQEPDLSEARLKLPFKWMYERCTLTLSGLANVCSWMLLVYRKRTERSWSNSECTWSDSESTSTTEPLRKLGRSI